MTLSLNSFYHYFFSEIIRLLMKSLHLEYGKIVETTKLYVYLLNSNQNVRC